MAFAFLQSIIPDPEAENEDESDIDVDPMDLEEDSSDDSDMEGEAEGGQSTVNGSRPSTSIAQDFMWSDILSNVTDQMLPFEQYAGPIHDLDDSVSGPIDYFKLFIGDEQIDMMVRETNRYAEQKQEATGIKDKYWKPVDAADISNYIAINILFGLHSVPEMHLYWSSDPFWRVPAVADIMGRQRFAKMNQYFHLADSTQQPARDATNYDPLFKVRPLVDHVRKQCQAVYRPGRNLACDEAMIGYTGRLGFKQYIKNKPTPWGIKIWCLAESETGYLLNFRIYTGKHEKMSPHGQGYDVVLQMANPYLDSRHIVFFDNFFSSPRLAQDLLERDTYSCGTIRPNRKGWPYPKRKQKKGDVSMKQSGLMVASQWMDKRQINVLSTCSDPGMVTVSRKSKAGPVNVEIPIPVRDYNSGMFGVDLSDQNRSYYAVGRSGRKWWRYIVWYLIQTAIINSFRLMKSANPNAPHHSPASTHLYFRAAVVKALVKTATHKKPAAEAPSVSGQARPFSPTHSLSKMSGRKKRCFQCYQDGNKMPSGRTKETTTGCHLCNVHLHAGTCYSRYHESLKD